jgi:PPOX class probable F420-dependent enzyme
MAEIAANVRAFLEEVRFATVATTNQDGSPHQAALWYELRGDKLVMNTASASIKVRNLRRDPRASVVVVDSKEARHVTLEGTVTLDESQVLADLTALALRYIGAEVGPGVAANIAAVPHVSLILTITRVKTFGNI